MTHSPEAIAAAMKAHPEPYDTSFTGALSAKVATKRAGFAEGFDAGVAATHARQYAATRDALIESIERTLGSGDWVTHVEAISIADALLDDSGPLLDAGEVAADAVAELADKLSRIPFARDEVVGLILDHEMKLRNEKP